MWQHRHLLGSILLACTLAPAWAQGSGAVVYHESFGPDAHPLYVFGGVIRFGPQPGDPWIPLLREGKLEISNTTDPSVIRYYFLAPRQVPGWGDGAPLAARVEVGGSFGEAPGAGLIYGVDPDTHAFVALVRTGTSDYGIYVLDVDGYRAIATGTSPALVEGVPAVLAIVPEAGGLGFYVAGERVFEGPPANGVGVGIVAAGTGRFRYDDFVLERP
jgi:hypothetical protein